VALRQLHIFTNLEHSFNLGQSGLWSAPEEQQTIGRVLHHGQNERVVVYRLIARNTADEILLDFANGKAMMLDQFMGTNQVAESLFGKRSEEVAEDSEELPAQMGRKSAVRRRKSKVPATEVEENKSRVGPKKTRMSKANLEPKPRPIANNAGTNVPETSTDQAVAHLPPHMPEPGTEYPSSLSKSPLKSKVEAVGPSKELIPAVVKLVNPVPAQDRSSVTEDSFVDGK
jgi:hypothetical protein